MTSIPRTESDVAPAETEDADVYVIGEGDVGVAVVRRIIEDGGTVALIDGSYEHSDLPVHRVDPTDREALADVGLATASTVVVTTPSDGRNLLVAQLIRARFDVDRILVVANEPDNVQALGDAGHDPLCGTTVLADTVVDQL